MLDGCASSTHNMHCVAGSPIRAPCRCERRGGRLRRAYTTCRHHRRVRTHFKLPSPVACPWLARHRTSHASAASSRISSSGRLLPPRAVTPFFCRTSRMLPRRETLASSTLCYRLFWSIATHTRESALRRGSQAMSCVAISPARGIECATVQRSGGVPDDATSIRYRAICRYGIRGCGID